MGSECPQTTRSIQFYQWKVSKNTTITSTSSSEYIIGSTSPVAVFTTIRKSGRGFAPLAIAQVTTDFCISFSLQIVYRGGSVPQTTSIFAGLGVFDSNMNLIYDAGVSSKELPGRFETSPLKRMLPVTTTVSLKISYNATNDKFTFFNGEKTIDSSDHESPVNYVALMMRGEGYYEARFTNVKCSNGVTAMSSLPSISSPVPGKTNYLLFENVKTDSQVLSSGDVNDENECKNECDTTETCTGFDIVTATNFCTLHKVSTPLPTEDVYTDSYEYDLSKWTIVDDMANNVKNKFSIWNQVQIIADTIRSQIQNLGTSTFSESVILQQITDLKNFYPTMGPTQRTPERQKLIDDLETAVNEAIATYTTETFSGDQVQNHSLDVSMVNAFDSLGVYMALCHCRSTPRLMAIYLYKKQVNGRYAFEFDSALYVPNYPGAINYPLYVLFDKENSIICSTTIHGIFKYTRNADTGTYSSSDNIQINPTNNVTKIVMDKTNEYMVIHNSSSNISQLLRKQANGTYSLVHDPNINLETLEVRDVTISRNDILAFCYYIPVYFTGLIYVHMYNLKTSTGIRIISTPSNQPVKNMIFDENEEVFAFTQNSKIFIYNTSGIKQYEIQLPSNIIHATFDKSGVYLATVCENGILYVLRKRGNLKFVFSESFSTTIQLNAGITSTLYKYLSFDSKENKLSLSVVSDDYPYGWFVKIYKKLMEEEPTRFISPSPEGINTYIKLENPVFEKICMRIDFLRTNDEGGGLKDFVKDVLNIKTIIFYGRK